MSHHGFWGSLPATGCGGGPDDHPLIYLEEIWQTGEDSDFKVRLSNGVEIACHRIIVSAQCPFFRHALVPGRFKEGITQIVNMPHDPPHAIRALLEYMYRAGYSLDESNVDLPDMILQHLDILVAASLYDMPKLEELAERWLQGTIKRHWPAALAVLPEMLAIMAHHASAGLSWARRFYYTLLYSLKPHMRTLLEEDAWDGLWRHAPGFMQEQTGLALWLWREQGGDVGMAREWLARYFAGVVVLRAAKCPRCARVNGLVFSKRQPVTNSCWWCMWSLAELRISPVWKRDVGVFGEDVAAWLEDGV